VSVRVNMAVSLDGRIALPSRKRFRLGGDEDLARLTALRAWADVVVVGAATIRTEDPPFSLPAAEARKRAQDGRSPHPAVAVVTASLDLGIGRVFTGPNHAIVAVPDPAPAPSPELDATAEIWRFPEARVAADQLLGRLRSAGYERILVEGGGGTAAGFFAADLVDELYLTLTPWFIGGDDAPAICEAGGVLPGTGRFALAGIEKRAEEVFLLYRRRYLAEGAGGTDSVPDQ